jgi:predicted amidohydrolase YtcJ
VLVDDLFGPERGGAWADAGAAFAAGHRATFHNDGWVTPAEPLQHGGRRDPAHEVRRVMPAARPSRAQALAAHTGNAAWQLFSEHDRIPGSRAVRRHGRARPGSADRFG